MSFPRYPKYKDSGAYWIGKVPAHWDIRRLGYYFAERREKVSDQDFSALSVTKNGIVPQLETAAKSDDGENRKRVCAGDFVINSRSDRKGSAGVSALDGSVSLICTVLKPLDEIIPSFVHHLLRSVPFQEEYYRNGKGIVADLWSTNYGEMRNILLAIPPANEQRGIAQFLDGETAKIDALIAEQKRLMTLLHEKRQTLITDAVTKGLNPDAPMKPSGVEWLGEVPAHWSVLPLKHLTKPETTITYGIVQAGPDVEGGVPYIRTSDMAGVELPAEGYLRTSPEIDAFYRRSKVETDDLVVAIRATLGKGLLVPAHLAGANLTQGTARVSPGEKLTPRFLLLAFNSIYVQATIDFVAKGTTFREITLDALRRIPIAVPPLHEQKRIVEYLDTTTLLIDSLTADVEKAVQLLIERRRSLITSAVTGQIELRPDAQFEAA